MGKSNRGTKCIIISGIDGSGKSTIIEETQKALEVKGYKVGYIWLRFNHYLTKIMHALARVIGISVKVHNEMGDVWQHQFYRNQTYCSIYILTTFIDTWISRLKYNKMAKVHDVVICDRWITDILVDLATKTHRENLLDSKWMSRFLKILPKDAMMFVVIRNQKALMECRLENRIDPDFSFRLGIYKKLCKKPYIHVVDNNGTIPESVKQITDKL